MHPLRSVFTQPFDEGSASQPPISLSFPMCSICATAKTRFSPVLTRWPHSADGNSISIPPLPEQSVPMQHIAAQVSEITTWILSGSLTFDFSRMGGELVDPLYQLVRVLEGRLARETTRPNTLKDISCNPVRPVVPDSTPDRHVLLSSPYMSPPPVLEGEIDRLREIRAQCRLLFEGMSGAVQRDTPAINQVTTFSDPHIRKVLQSQQDEGIGPFLVSSANGSPAISESVVSPPPSIYAQTRVKAHDGRAHDQPRFLQRLSSRTSQNSSSQLSDRQTSIDRARLGSAPSRSLPRSGSASPRGFIEWIRGREDDGKHTAADMPAQYNRTSNRRYLADS